ncbi:hypothetical protein MKZ38_009346 [Zalerion maritima]|uniref:Uncharacterized protein n=1 Tax=Zalerion maritima TaxID=339359 RepID=A0AAD5WT06_9PEZI|nr:hypothetical protein MKZ38_009346 [Zalerion maritima]
MTSHHHDKLEPGATTTGPASEPKTSTSQNPATTEAKPEPETTTAATKAKPFSKLAMGRPRFKAPSHYKPSPMATLLYFLILTLPPILYLVAMALAIATTRTPDFVRQNVLDFSADFSNRDDLVHHQSPWFSCPFDLNFDEPDSFREFCAGRDALGEAATSACIAGADGLDPKDMVCPKITMVAELYTAAAVLLGVGALVTAMFGVASCTTTTTTAKHSAGDGNGEGGGRARGDSEVTTTDTMTRFVGSFGYLVGVAGAACLVAGQVLGYTVMVVELSPDEVTQSDDFTRFFPGKALLTYTSTAYALALGATFMGVTKCGLRH